MRMQIDLTRFEACPPYNEWLDRNYTGESGALNILGFQPRPSEVLFTMSQDTYQATFADFQREWEDELTQMVFDDFPSPIAHYFYRFDAGYESELQRLHFLRDTWEALVDVLHTLAISECRFRSIALTDPLAFSHVMTDSVAQRLLNIERILTHAANQGIALGIGQIVSITTLDKMRELNQSRNAFSHSAAQSEAQAREWIGDCYADVIDVLDDLRGLGNVEVYRYLGQVDGQTLRCEAFWGHGITKTIQNLPLTADQVRDSQRYFHQGQILALCNGSVFGLRPLVTYREDAGGHVTRLCMFRKTRGDAPDRRIEFEVVGEAVRLEQDRVLFKLELDELRALFGLGPD